MSKAAKHKGLQEAHKLLHAYHQEIASEHERTPASFFGRPTKRHHELLGASKALVELGHRMVILGAEIIAKKEVA